MTKDDPNNEHDKTPTTSQIRNMYWNHPRTYRKYINTELQSRAGNIIELKRSDNSSSTDLISHNIENMHTN